MTDYLSKTAGEYQVKFDRETLLTFAMADYEALKGSEFEAVRWAPYMHMVLSMARSVASNSYVIEERFEEHLPATFWDWAKSALIVPGFATAGLVAPMSSRLSATAFSPSSTCTMTGPDVMNAIRSG